MSNNKRSKKRSNKKKYIKKGGKFLGRGTHGCVFGEWKDTLALSKISPDCLPPKKYKNKGIKVLSSYKNLMQEWNTTKMIRELVPSFSNWFYIPEKICKVKNMHPEDTVLIGSSNSGCHFNIDNNGGLVLPIADLSGSAKVNESIETILIAFRNLFEGIYILGKNNIVHNDLKDGNVVYSTKDKKYYIIDFGHARTFQQEGWREAKLEDILNYHAWPFDWFFGTYLLRNILYDSYRNIRYNYSISELINNLKITDFKSLWIMFIKKFENSKKISPRMSGLDLTQEKINNWYKLLVNYDLKLNLADYISLSVQKLDVWSLAKCCSTIIEKNFPNNNSKLIFDFKNLMDVFLSLSVYHRPTAKQAYHMYDKFLIDNKLIVYK